MNCENSLCIYEENGVCCLDQIDINYLGLCEQCINISISDETLNILKRKTRERIMRAEEISQIQCPTIEEMIEYKKDSLL